MYHALFQVPKLKSKWTKRFSNSPLDSCTGDHAYCRNPDKSNTGPWCLTTELDMTREACHVPRCNAVCKPGTGLSLAARGHVNRKMASDWGSLLSFY